MVNVALKRAATALLASLWHSEFPRGNRAFSSVNESFSKRFEFSENSHRIRFE